MAAAERSAQEVLDVFRNTDSYKTWIAGLKRRDYVLVWPQGYGHPIRKVDKEGGIILYDGRRFHPDGTFDRNVDGKQAWPDQAWSIIGPRSEGSPYAPDWEPSPRPLNHVDLKAEIYGEFDYIDQFLLNDLAGLINNWAEANGLRMHERARITALGQQTIHLKAGQPTAQAVS